MGTRNRDGKRQEMERGNENSEWTGKIGTGKWESGNGIGEVERGMGARNRCCIIDFNSSIGIIYNILSL